MKIHIDGAWKTAQNCYFQTTSCAQILLQAKDTKELFLWAATETNPYVLGVWASSVGYSL